MFPETVADESGNLLTSVKVDGFAGLQIKDPLYTSASGSRSFDGVVPFRCKKYLPKEQFEKTINFVRKNGSILLEKAFKAVLDDDYRRMYDFLNDPDFQPEIRSEHDFRHHCEIKAVYITSDYTDGSPSFAIEFESTWDDHGVGVRFKGLEVIHIGFGEVADDTAFRNSRTGRPLRDPLSGQLLSEMRKS